MVFPMNFVKECYVILPKPRASVTDAEGVDFQKIVRKIY